MLSLPPGTITASWLSQEWLSSSVYFTLILESVLQIASNSGPSFLFFFFLIHKTFQLTELGTFQSPSSYLLQNWKPLNCPREGYKRPNSNQSAQINKRLNLCVCGGCSSAKTQLSHYSPRFQKKTNILKESFKCLCMRFAWGLISSDPACLDLERNPLHFHPDLQRPKMTSYKYKKI